MIPLAEPWLDKKEMEYVTRCLETKWISSLGEYVTKFEESFSTFCNTRYGIATSSGTTALHLALETLGIGPSDEVIIPSLTFVATANAVTYTGATPVFVDSEPYTWNMDPKELEKKVTPRTKAIIPVHLYGHPADMGPIMSIAHRYSLHVIEDAAEAHGAEYRGQRVGSIGEMGCFSFYANKIITTGEGGMITTNNKDFREKAVMLRDHAMSKKRKYWHPCIGYNYRMTNLQAALGVAQLEKISDILERKQHNARLYNDFLSKTKGITLPPQANWAKNVYWMYSILLEEDFGFSRDKVAVKLRGKGIDSRPFFVPMQQLPPYRTDEKFPVANQLSRKGISLPSGVCLRDDEIQYICRTIGALSLHSRKSKSVRKKQKGC